MSSLDLSGKNPITQTYSVDPITDNLTLILSEGLSAIGQIKIERVRFRAFAEALAELSKSITTDLDSRQKSRMIHNKRQNKADVTFG